MNDRKEALGAVVHGVLAGAHLTCALFHALDKDGRKRYIIFHAGAALVDGIATYRHASTPSESDPTLVES